MITIYQKTPKNTNKLVVGDILDLGGLLVTIDSVHMTFFDTVRVDYVVNGANDFIPKRYHLEFPANTEVTVLK